MSRSHQYLSFPQRYSPQVTSFSPHHNCGGVSIPTRNTPGSHPVIPSVNHTGDILTLEPASRITSWCPSPIIFFSLGKLSGFSKHLCPLSFGRDFPKIGGPHLKKGKLSPNQWVIIPKPQNLQVGHSHLQKKRKRLDFNNSPTIFINPGSETKLPKISEATQKSWKISSQNFHRRKIVFPL